MRQYGHSGRRAASLAMALGYLACPLALAACALASGDEPPAKHTHPLGISPEDATRIADPEKRALWEDEFHAQQTAAASTDPRANRPNAPLTDRTPVPAETLVAGIFEDVNSFGGFRFENVYQYTATNGDRYQAYAGTERDKPTKSVVLLIVMTEFLEPTDRGGVYYAPADEGALRIDSVNGSVLQLSAESGATLLFDLDTRGFAAQ